MKKQEHRRFVRFNLKVFKQFQFISTLIHSLRSLLTRQIEMHQSLVSRRYSSNQVFSSSWSLACSQVNESLVLGHCLSVDGLMVESAQGWLDIMSLPHFEVLSEVLISTPPILVDHTHSLVSSHLMEVRVSNIVLFAICWKTSI